MESRKANQPTGSGAETQPQRKLSAKDIVADIREGMSDQALERKYRLTPNQRENLFKKLIAKELMTEDELHWRINLLKSQEASGNVPASKATPIAPRDTDEKFLTSTESPSTSESKTGSIASELRDGYWVEDKKILILLLIFASPLGLYGLWKTSRFQTVTKVIFTVITTILVNRTMAGRYRPVDSSWYSGYMLLGVSPWSETAGQTGTYATAA